MHDAQDLARWAGIGLGAFSLGLVAYVGWMFFGKATFSVRERLLVLPALAILPGLTLTLSQGVAYAQMKRVEFCRSCHVMGAYAADLEDGKSSTLAAAHALNHRVDPDHACYACHSTYTLTGPVRDKIRGLRHLAVFYFGKSREDIALYEPFPNASCLHCHGGAKSFEDHVAHQSVMDQIAAGEMSCMTCHAGGAHPEGAKRRK